MPTTDLDGVALEAKFLAASDPAFRARATVEYKTLFAWLGNKFAWETASVLDFGCGEGVPAASIALRHPGANITAYDIAPPRIAPLKATLQRETALEVPDNLRLCHDWEALPDGAFDLVYAWSVFEHVAPPEMPTVLARIRARMAPGARFFVNCEPLFHSPHGSHLRHYLKTPWRHLREPLSVLRNQVISENSNERNAREWEQFTSLNRYTHQDLKAAFEAAGFRLARMHLSQSAEPMPADLLHTFREQALSVVGAQFLLLVADPPDAGAPAARIDGGQA
ncbi:methyltransferase domain-containing protein [Xylophilus sp. Kf1]|nr:methyltransferase domain-containing protein [Xylophilus sp. Kf1]